MNKPFLSQPFPIARSRIVSAFLAMSILILGVLTLISGCTRHTSPHSNPQSEPRVFRINIGTEPPEMDPIKVTDLTSFGIVLNIMRGLTLIDKGMAVRPAIAERWEKSPDGYHYTFHLDPKAQWSDGKPVTAQDFINGWKRALDPKNAAEYAFFLFEVKNGKAYYDRKITDFNQVGVHALDDHTLAVDLERPIAYFTALMASPIAMPIRQDIVDKYGDSFTEAGHFIGNGPYVLDSWIHENRLTLKPTPYYHKSKPGIDAVEMLMVNDANTSVVMYENDELDFIETPTSIPSFDVRRLKRQPDYHTGMILLIYYFGFDTSRPPFNNPKVRQAFAYALDRSYFPRLMQSGQKPFKSWIPPGLVGYNAEMGLGYDPQKAKRLMSEAGYPDGKGFPKVTFAYRTMYDIQKEAEIAQYLWKKTLNVDVKLENMEWKVFLNRLKTNPPNIFRLSWYADYPDADTYMSMFITTSGNNYTRWKNNQYDAWVAQAGVTQNKAERQKLYDQAQKLILEEDTAFIPTYIGEKGYMVKPRFQGVQVTELNLMYLDHLSIKEPK